MQKHKFRTRTSLFNMLLIGCIALLTGCATESSRPASGSVQIDWTDSSGAHSSKFYKHIYSTHIENKIVVPPGTSASASYRNSDNDPIFATDPLVCPASCPTGQTTVVTQSCDSSCTAACACEIPPPPPVTKDTPPDTTQDSVIDGIIDKAFSAQGYPI
jgi:hypothetical protein